MQADHRLSQDFLVVDTMCQRWCQLYLEIEKMHIFNWSIKVLMIDYLFNSKHHIKWREKNVTIIKIVGLHEHPMKSIIQQEIYGNWFVLSLTCVQKRNSIEIINGNCNIYMESWYSIWNNWMIATLSIDYVNSTDQ